MTEPSLLQIIIGSIGCTVLIWVTVQFLCWLSDAWKREEKHVLEEKMRIARDSEARYVDR